MSQHCDTEMSSIDFAPRQEEPVRVLHVFGTLDRGGAETAILNVYRHIESDRLQFDFVSHRHGPWDYESDILSRGGRIYVAPQYRGWNHMSYARWWRNFFDTHTEFVAVHGHVPGTASLYLSAAQRARVITLAHAHTTVHGGRLLERGVKGLLAKRIAEHADYLLACSPSAAVGMFGSDALGTKPCRIMQNAIDVKLFAFDPATRMDIRAELGLGSGLVIGHVGRFEPVKNHEFLLQVFGHILERDSSAMLLLVGDGPLRPRIERKAHHLGIAGSVVFTGMREDTHRLLQGMDAFVFPSLYEGLGLALVEAQASGLKVYASDGVPSDAIITHDAGSLDLCAGAQSWADSVYAGASTQSERNDASALVAAAGYDVSDTAHDLQDFYLGLTSHESS